jgi:hypothetical protein
MTGVAKKELLGSAVPAADIAAVLTSLTDRFGAFQVRAGDALDTDASDIGVSDADRSNAATDDA